MHLKLLAASVVLAGLFNLTGAYAQAPAAKPAASAAKPAASPGYSVANSNMGQLLGDPAAKAVLVKYIPDMVNNPQTAQASSLTLKDLQQFAPDYLTDQTLAKIDKDLSTLPVKK